MYVVTVLWQRKEELGCPVDMEQSRPCGTVIVRQQELVVVLYTLFRPNQDVITLYIGDLGGTVVKVLCYKSEDRWFDPSWCHWNFSVT